MLEGIEASARLFDTIKIDTVVMRGVNDDELVPLLEYARARRAEVRFIEYMDVGGATRWSPDKVMSGAEILERLEAHYGHAEPIGETTWAPADRYRLPRRHRVRPDRLDDVALLQHLRPGAADGGRRVADVPLRDRRHQPPRAAAGGSLARPNWRVPSPPPGAARSDRGAELRAAERQRGIYIPAAALKGNPHLEMHTRGG